jgi:hypothetical protein
MHVVQRTLDLRKGGLRYVRIARLIVLDFSKSRLIAYFSLPLRRIAG